MTSTLPGHAGEPASAATNVQIAELEADFSGRAGDDRAAASVSSAPDVPRSLSRLTIDDAASMIGSAAGGLAFTWVVYEHILAFTGTVGFIAAAWLTFMIFYGAVTAMSHPVPVIVDRLIAAVMASGATLIFSLVAWVVIYVFKTGWPALHHANFYTQTMAGVRPTDPLSKGGILHAIVGSGIQVGIATGISVPLGIGTAVYLSEVGGRVAQTVRVVVEAMTALPDILAGLFIYTFLILGLHWQRDGMAAALALAVTMTPIVARSAEVVLRVVPGGLREAALALGASRWQSVWRVVIPTARSGLATSLILGIARVAGETAPLIIVSGASTIFNKNPLNREMNSLPLFIFTGVRSGEPNYVTRAWGAAAVLLTLVLILFITARYLSRNRLKASR